MALNPSVAVITPLNKGDYLVDTVLDGLLDSGTDFRVSSQYPGRVPVGDRYLAGKEFAAFAEAADLVLLCWGKDNTDMKLAESIGCWEKTAYIDGSEVGRNRRYDFTVQRDILAGHYADRGKIEWEILEKAALYLRREKPYVGGVTPFPFGITVESRQAYGGGGKDIDFVCLFGQDEYPLLRRYAREVLEEYCGREGFVCVTEPVGREEFYRLLARAKVGVSVGGGGYDTARFWELLGANCLLLTETIDIYEPGAKALDYPGRFWQFSNLYDFKFQLERIGRYLREEYREEDTLPQYREIIGRHSSEARVAELFEAARRAGIITK